MLSPSPTIPLEAKVKSNEFMSSSVAAKRFNVTTRTVTRWILEGNFPGAFKINPDAENSAFLIPVSEIEAFEKKRQSQAPLNNE